MWAVLHQAGSVMMYSSAYQSKTGCVFLVMSLVCKVHLIL